MLNITPAEQDLRDDPLNPHPFVEEGTVGWAGVAEVADSEPGEPTLIRVTLRRGRTPGATIEGGAADGTQILARLAGPDWRIMPAGTRCQVAIPGGAIEAMGMGVLIKYLEAAPLELSSTNAVLDFRGQKLTIMADEIDLITSSGVKVELRSDRASVFGPLGNEIRQDALGQILLGGDLAALGVLTPSPNPPGFAPSVMVKAKMA